MEWKPYISPGCGCSLHRITIFLTAATLPHPFRLTHTLKTLVHRPHALHLRPATSMAAFHEVVAGSALALVAAAGAQPVLGQEETRRRLDELRCGAQNVSVNFQTVLQFAARHCITYCKVCGITINVELQSTFIYLHW